MKKLLKSGPGAFLSGFILTIILLFGIAGCQTKADKEIITGVVKLEAALISLSAKNASLWKKELAELESKLPTSTEEEKVFLLQKIDEAKQLIYANERVPAVIKKLREALIDERNNE